MADYGHRKTDELIAEIQKRVEEEYSKALAEVRAKADNYFKSFQAKDVAKRKLVEAGMMSEAEYKKWRLGQVMMNKRWNEMADTLAADLANADQIAMSIVNEYTPEAYAINHNYGTFEIETGSLLNTSYTLYDRQTVERLLRDNPKLLPNPNPKKKIPKDKIWNKKKINSAITQGVLQGDDMRSISKRLRSVTDMDKVAAMRNARTAMTGAQNAGRLDSYRRAEGMGIVCKKQWLAAGDARVRPSHRDISGESVEIEQAFSNDLMYPGDPDGEPAEVYNCRCTMVCEVDADATAKADTGLTVDPALADIDFEDWEVAHNG